MKMRRILLAGLAIAVFLGPGAIGGATQENPADIQVIVNMVQLNVAVTDNKGNYVTGLHPEDFVVSEDGITQKIATFGEGSEPTRRIIEATAENRAPGTGSYSARHAGQCIYKRLELSALRHRMCSFCSIPAITCIAASFSLRMRFRDFVRSLENADKIAFYSYSRDLSRSSMLTKDRSQVLHSVRSTVAGDDAALYNSPAAHGQRCCAISGTESNRSVLQRAGQLPASCRRKMWPNWRSPPEQLFI